jgi:hypothetical protein
VVDGTVECAVVMQCDMMSYAVLCSVDCDVLCRAVLCCACAVLCCAVRALLFYAGVWVVW